MGELGNKLLKKLSLLRGQIYTPGPILDAYAICNATSFLNNLAYFEMAQLR